MVHCRSDRARTRLTSRWRDLALAGLLAVGLAAPAAAQVNYTYGWDPTGLGGWSGMSRTTVAPCGGAGAVRVNLYSSVPSNTFLSPVLGTSAGQSTAISFAYKVVNWSDGSATPNPWGNMVVQWANSTAGPWTTIGTVDQTNHVQATACATKSYNFTPTSGSLYVRFVSTWQTPGDYYIYLDNVTLVESLPPCSGTPSPGNTITSADPGACSGVNFTVSTQNVDVGNNLSYQWERDNGSGWANFGTNARTQTVSQTGPTSYRCTVTCPTTPASTTSNPLLVNMATTFPVTFNSTAFPANCWTIGPNITYMARSNVQGNAAAGTGSAIFQFYDASAGQELSITSTPFTAATDKQIRFDVSGTYYLSGATVVSDLIHFDYSTNGGTSWTTLTSMSNALGGILQTVPGQNLGFAPTTSGQWASRTVPLPNGTNRIRFRGVSNFGQNVYIDNISLENQPPCVTPFAVTGVGLSTTSASIGWLGTGSFILEYGPAATFTTPGTGATGGPEGTSTVITGATNPYTIPSGLVHPTQYRVFVREDCTGIGEGYSPNSSASLFYAAPPYDVCSSITSIPNVGAGGTVLLTGNTFGARDTEGFGANVAWEAFTLTECVSTLNVNYCGSTPARTSAYTNLFLGCPHSAGFIQYTGTLGAACPNGSINIPYINVPAGTYYIPVAELPAANGPYGINVVAGAACPPGPANDLCEDASPITPGQTVNGTTVGANTAGAPATLCNGLLNNGTGGVWYKAEDICGPVTATLCATTPTWNSKIAIYSGACGASNLVCVTADDNGCGVSAGLSTASWTADADLTYFIYVLPGYVNPGPGTAVPNAFTLTLNGASSPVTGSATPVDDCANGVFDLNVDVTSLGAAASVTVSYSVDGGTAVNIPGVTLSGTTIQDIPATSGVHVTITNGATGCDLDLGNYFSNCPVQVVCGNTVVVEHCYENNDTRTFSFLPPTPGETITLAFVSGSMDAGDVIRGYSGSDNLGTPIPGLTGSFASLASVTGTSAPGEGIFLEIESDGSNSCADGQQTSWEFEVECTPGCIDPTGSATENSVCATYTFTLDVEVLSAGDALTTTLEYTVNGGPVQSVPGLVEFDVETIGPFTIGSSVSVVLAHESDGTCDRNLGSFDGNTSCPPPGVSCALPLVVSSFPYTQSSSTCTRGNDHLGTQCGLVDAYGGGEDVVYQLDIPAAGEYQINLTLTGGSTFGGWFLKAPGSCATASSCLASAVSGTGNTANAIYDFAAPGSYFLIIDSRPLPNCVAYTLNIAPYTPQPGEMCSVAIDIPTLPASVAGSTAAFFDNHNEDCVDSNGPGGRDVVYSYTPDTDKILNLSLCQGTTNFDTKMYVYADVCSGAPVGCNEDACTTPLFGLPYVSRIMGLPVTGGTTYYIVVDGYTATSFGNYTLDIEEYIPTPGEDCASAIVIPSVPASVSGNTADMLDNYDQECSIWVSDIGGLDVVYSYTPPVNQVIDLSLCQGTTEFDTKMYVYLSVCSGSSIACSEDVCSNGTLFEDPYISRISTLSVTAGTTYYIVVDGYDDISLGDYTLDISISDPPPANDLCANAEPLTVQAVGQCPANATTGTTYNAGSEAGLVSCDEFDGIWRDVWYAFNSGAFTAINYAVETITQDGPAGVSLFSACGGTELDCDLGESVSGTWTVTPNTNYRVRVSANVEEIFGAVTPGTFSICLSRPACTTDLTIDFTVGSNGNVPSWELRAGGIL